MEETGTEKGGKEVRGDVHNTIPESSFPAASASALPSPSHSSFSLTGPSIAASAMPTTVLPYP